MNSVFLSRKFFYTYTLNVFYAHVHGVATRSVRLVFGYELGISSCVPSFPIGKIFQEIIDLLNFSMKDMCV